MLLSKLYSKCDGTLEKYIVQLLYPVSDLLVAIAVVAALPI